MVDRWERANVETTDLILRTMAATQLLFLALVLVRRARTLPALRYAAFLPLGLAAFAATSAPGAQLGLLAAPLTLLCVANPVWFWIFTEALFDDDFRLELRHVAALAAMMTSGTWHELVLPFPPQGPAHWLFLAAAVGFLALAVVRVVRGKGGDLIESRRRWRGGFVAAVSAYGAIALALMAAYGGQLPSEIALLNIALLFVVALVASVLLPGPVAPTVAKIALPPPGGHTRPKPVDDALLRQVRDAMEVKRLYCDENLTVAALARSLGSQEYLVRRAINGGLGYRNFNEFLHHYRLTEAAARLHSQSHLPILSIALDVGYGSIGPFNRAFRRRFGVTPSEYRTQPTATATVSASA
jgi:AraC-like DNA-binding protein